MGKIMKIFKDEANLYSGNCYVNTVIFRGRIYEEFHGVGHGGIKFSLQLSNGQNKETGEWKRSASPKGDTMRPTGAWRKPTFADCTAFSGISKQILKDYKPKDEIWIIAKYYLRQKENKYYCA